MGRELLYTTSELLEILRNKPCILYCAGRVTRTIVEFISKYDDVNVLGILVTDIKGNPENILGIPVYGLEGYEKQNRDVYIVVCAMEKLHDEIANVLIKYSYKLVTYISNKLYSDIMYINGNFDLDILASVVHNQQLLKGINFSLEKIRREQIEVIKRVNEVTSLKRYGTDILDGMNFDRVIAESSWIKSKDFAPGGMAVNSKYLYTLYKILDSKSFHSILDIGMGQTTKMISQYVQYDKEARHVIVESDKEWIEFFGKCFQEMQRTVIHQLEYTMDEFCGVEVRCFKDFVQTIKGKKFDYISIDAPLGGDMKEYSRIDIIELLPECLAESWIIMLDDVQRRGEQNTLVLIKEQLEGAKIKYCEKLHQGCEKTFAILTSYDNRFYCTI